MEYLEKATVSQSKKKRNIIKITIVAVICIAGLALGIYSAVVKNYLYAALYLVAIILGIAYVIIKINTIMPAYIAADKSTVYMQCWENGAFPYKINFKPAFFADFIPAKVTNKEILIEDIKTVLVGSKNYLVRNLEGTDFVDKMNKISKTRKTENGALRRMDFICIVNKDGEISFMPTTDMEPGELARLVNLIYRKNPEVEIKCNLREIRSRLTVQ